MKLFGFRIALVLALLVLLYEKVFFCKILALIIFIIQLALSPLRFYRSPREKILCLLADKLLFTTVLIVLADLRVFKTGMVAWIVGSVFIHSGIDLLEVSLTDSLDLRPSSHKNFIYMILTLLGVFLFVLRRRVDPYIFILLRGVISWSLAFLSGLFIFQCLASDRFKKLTKEA